MSDRHITILASLYAGTEIALRLWRHAMTMGVVHCAFTLTPTSFHAGCWHPERGISVGLPSKDCQRIRSGMEIALRRWRHAMTLQGPPREKNDISKWLAFFGAHQSTKRL